MSFTFKWPSRKKTSSAASKRTAVTRKPRGKEALTARKPASGWTIKLTGLKTSLAQIGGITEDIEVDYDQLEYDLGYSRAVAALQGYHFTDAFVEGFIDGLTTKFD